MLTEFFRINRLREFMKMSTINLKLFTAGCLLLALCCDLEAASGFRKKSVGTSGAQFLKLGVNARAIGMGEAYSAVADGSDAIYWNPAGLGRIENKSLSFMHASYLQNIFYDFTSYAQRVGSVGTFGIGIQYLNATSIDETDEFGTTVGKFNPYDLAISVGWARTFKDVLEDKDFIFGLSGKFIQSKIIETANAGAVDAGISWNALEKCWFSLGIQNLGSGLKFKEESFDLPVNIKLGSSYAVYKPLLLALDVNFPKDNAPNASLGAEYKVSIAPDMWFASRGGYNSRSAKDLTGLSSVSAGMGLGWKGYGIDFAWVPFGELGHTYRVSLSVKY